jgi:hypothetical protein
MIKPKELLDRLGSLSTFDFKGEVFRATRLGLDPVTPSTRGGGGPRPTNRMTRNQSRRFIPAA